MERQLSLAETLLDPGLGSNPQLEAIAAVIDWSPLEQLAASLHTATTGRPPYPPGAMIRALYLQTLYGLSDPGLQSALADRLSFRRFCGLGFGDTTPDETTICRFRMAASQKGVLEACFQEVTRQLDAKGLILRKGTLIDATILTSASRKPAHKAGKAAGASREPGASWTRKNGKSYFGYRLHIGADKDHVLIRALRLTPAHVNESPVAESLICGDEKAVYADKGYEHKGRRARLRAKGVKDRICHRADKHYPKLGPWKVKRNRAIAKRRAPVERVFASAKRVFNYARVRSANFAVNLGQAFCFATVFNLKRAAKVLAA